MNLILLVSFASCLTLELGSAPQIGICRIGGSGSCINDVVASNG